MIRHPHFNIPHQKQKTSNIAINNNRDFYGWYDFTVEAGDFQRRLAGHLETGYDSMSDPAFGSSATNANERQ
ncbi:MAG TPA: hypothetical protein VE242_05645 [Chthoniobacterales bacterium]|nr:hypothetical protein [Chthoniobacterales bacterium]